jgi:hypothetical protein
MLDPDRTLLVAAQVAAVAEALGIKTALIGAAALAVHGYARGTEDIDLASWVRPHDQLDDLAKALTKNGLRTQLRLPDDDDPLGGVLVVWASSGDDGEPADVVEVVNFLNPARPSPNPAARAISRAVGLAGVALRCVGLADLVALKLYAGGSSDLADIVQLLARNPNVDFEEIRYVAGPYDENRRLEQLLAEARQLGSRTGLPWSSVS